MTTDSPDDCSRPRRISRRNSSRQATTLSLGAALAVCFLAGVVWAAPFAKYFHFTQPDGTELTLWGQGDEFHAVFETTAGYTVVFDPQRRAYFYAVRAADGKSLVATGVPAHRPPPPGLAQHIRMDADAVAAAARARQQQWDKDMRISERWALLKSRTLGTPVLPQEDGPVMAPPGSSTTGAKLGLTLLIDFPDAEATITKEQVEDFCNGDNYTAFGNNGSVKKYFSDVSAGRLTYQNVVTIYVRMIRPKTYYDDTSKDCGVQGNLLIKDALAILKARTDYTSTILPTFNSLTVDASNWVVAFNVFFAGANSGVWSYGLWPHSWVLNNGIRNTPVDLGNGKLVCPYQITDIGTSLELGTFCHENGHMLCDFPDIYDYGYDSVGGAGVFCLMNNGGFGTNPKQVCAYLKLAAGWATVTDVNSSTALTASLVAAPDLGYDHFYRFRKPGVSTEYFLMENRQKAGRDAGLPAAGIAVWHIDELGNRDNQSLAPNTAHLNYEVTLVQADNQWHFQNNVNAGDSNDLYYQGNGASSYVNRLYDSSRPNAHWWDGTASGMDLKSFSGPGMTMTFTVGPTPLPPPALSAEPPATSGTENTIYWAAASGAPVGTLSEGIEAIRQAPPPAVVFENGGNQGADPLVLPVNVFPRSDKLDRDPPSYTPGSSTWAWSGSISIPEGPLAGEVGLNCSPPTGVPGNAYITQVQLHHEITHPRIADLECRLTNSLGKNWLFRDNSSTGGPNLVEDVTDTTRFYGDTPVQSWYYRVRDNVGGKATPGTITRFQLVVSYESPPAPDLQMSGASWASGTVTEGAPFWVQGSIENNGNAPAAASHVRLYLSTDNDFDIADDYYVGEKAVGELAVGEAETVQWDFDMPSRGSGDYPVWMVFVVDSRNEVVESFENNTFATLSSFIASDPVEYYAECSANELFTSPVNSGWIQQLQFTFSSLTPGQTYWYRVKKRWAGQESLWSNVEFSQQGSIHISGAVNYYAGTQKVPGVDVVFAGDDNHTVVTGTDGSYSGNVISGWSGNATPVRTTDAAPNQGVSSADQLLIQRHILGIAALDSPYKLLGADVNGSGRINSADQLLIQRVILGIDAQFPLGLWRFVPANYVFSDPANPWAAPGARSYTDAVNDLAGQDFVAVKLGDVNGSWTAPAGSAAFRPEPSMAVAQTASFLGLEIEGGDVRPRERISVPVRSHGFQQLTSLQFTLTWDPAVLRLAGTDAYGLRGLSNGNMRALLEEGKLLCAWFDPATEGVELPEDSILFRLEFEAVGSAGSFSLLVFAGSPVALQASVSGREVRLGTQQAVVHVVGNMVGISEIGYEADTFRLSVPTLAGRCYVLEFSDEFPAASWRALSSVEGDGSVRVLTDSAATNIQRYYRVRAE